MSAIKYLADLKSYLDSGEFKVECIPFRLHYQLSVIILIGASVLLTAAEFFGDPINCITNLDPQVVNTYCWIESTFTIQDYSLRERGINQAQPGVFTPDGYDDEEVEKKWRYHNYYQWVVFFLFFQAFLCYLPKYIWSICEGGLMSTIASGLNRTMYKEDETDPQKKVVINYIATHIKMHNSYVFKYWFCEFIAFVNIIGQLFFIDKFLGGEFLTYGPRVVEYSNMDQEQRVDPMIYVFPRMTKCHFHKFGSSGTIERHDAFCILPLNIFNEKVFILVWFWFVILSVMLGSVLIYRLAVLFMPKLRPMIIHKHNKAVEMDTLVSLSKKINVGDWWILHILSENVDALIYRDIMSHLAKEIDTNASNNAYSPPGGGHFSSSV